MVCKTIIRRFESGSGLMCLSFSLSRVGQWPTSRNAFVTPAISSWLSPTSRNAFVTPAISSWLSPTSRNALDIPAISSWLRQLFSYLELASGQHLETHPSRNALVPFETHSFLLVSRVGYRQHLETHSLFQLSRVGFARTSRNGFPFSGISRGPRGADVWD
jgi:hypothetical protein